VVGVLCASNARPASLDSAVRSFCTAVRPRFQSCRFNSIDATVDKNETFGLARLINHSRKHANLKPRKASHSVKLKRWPRILTRS